MVSHHILDAVRNRFILSGRDSRYPVDAYNFILQGIQWHYTKTGTVRHFTGQELVLGLLDLANIQFGFLTQDLLAYWGITTSNDFGNIIYNLIELNTIQKQESDSLSDFSNVVDFDEYFSSQDYFRINNSYIQSVKEA